MRPVLIGWFMTFFVMQEFVRTFPHHLYHTKNSSTNSRNIFLVRIRKVPSNKIHGYSWLLQFNHHQPLYCSYFLCIRWVPTDFSGLLKERHMLMITVT